MLFHGRRFPKVMTMGDGRHRQRQRFLGGSGYLKSRGCWLDSFPAGRVRTGECAQPMTEPIFVFSAKVAVATLFLLRSPRSFCYYFFGSFLLFVSFPSSALLLASREEE